MTICDITGSLNRSLPEHGRVSVQCEWNCHPQCSISQICVGDDIRCIGQNLIAHDAMHLRLLAEAPQHMCMGCLERGWKCKDDTKFHSADSSVLHTVRIQG